MVTNAGPLLSTTDWGAAVAQRRHDDAAVLARFGRHTAWGLATAIDLQTCDARLIRDAAHIGRFVVALCAEIEMKRYGEPLIVRFGADERVCGYSLVQMIE